MEEDDSFLSSSEEDENEQNDLLLLTLGDDQEKEEEGRHLGNGETRVAFTPLQHVPGAERYFARRTREGTTCERDEGLESKVAIESDPTRSLHGRTDRIVTDRDVPSATPEGGEEITGARRARTTAEGDYARDPGALTKTRKISKENRNEYDARVRNRIPGPAGSRSLHTSISEEAALRSLDDGGGSEEEEEKEEAENPFLKGPWLTLCQKLGRSPSGRTVNVDESVRTIDRVLSDKFYTKVPDIAIVVSSLVRSSSYCGEATFVDPTGTIRAIVHRDALERWKRDEFVAGAALHLKNVTVFTVRIGEHALVVTERNIAKLVPPTATAPAPVARREASRDDDDDDDDTPHSIRGRSLPQSSHRCGHLFQRSILSSLSATAASSHKSAGTVPSSNGENLVQDIFGETLTTPSPLSQDCTSSSGAENKKIEEDMDDSFEVVDEEDVAALATASWGARVGDRDESGALETKNLREEDKEEEEEEEEEDDDDVAALAAMSWATVPLRASEERTSTSTTITRTTAVAAEEVTNDCGDGEGGEEEDDDDENSDSELLVLDGAWG